MLQHENGAAVLAIKGVFEISGASRYDDLTSALSDPVGEDDCERYVQRMRGLRTLQTTTLDPFNDALPARLLPLVQARRARRGSARGLLDRF